MSTLAAPAPAARPGFLAREWLPVALFLGLALVPLLGLTGLVPRDGWLLSLVARAMILAIAALALDLVLGLGGMASFGQAAPLGIGAYAVGILMAHGVDDALVGLIVGVGAAALFALVTGAIALRTRGVHFIMITLAFGQMAYFTAASLSAYGGDDGLPMARRALVFGQAWLKDGRAYHFIVLAVLVLAYLGLRRLKAARFGRVLRAAAQNEARAASLGFEAFPVRLAALTLAGALTGLAGVLLANESEFVSPATMAWQRSGDLLIMVILGGRGTLHGAVLGALAVVLVEDGLAALTEHWRIVFGPLLVLAVLFGRGGGLVDLLRRPSGARGAG